MTEAIDKLNNLHYKILHSSFGSMVYVSEIEALCMAKDVLQEIQQYREIGTVEEFKALKEKSVAKKIVYVSNMGVKTPHCPNCDMELTMNMYQRKFCDCGQKLDWQ